MSKYWMSGFESFDDGWAPAIQTETGSVRYPTGRIVIFNDGSAQGVNWRKAKKLARKGLIKSSIKCDGYNIIDELQCHKAMVERVRAAQ